MPVKLEKSYLDKFVNGYFLGKRQIGRPIKYNIRTKDRQGWVELVFNPRTRVEQYMSNAMRFIHPYLFHITYKFHVEKAREAGKYFSSNSASRTVARLWSPAQTAKSERVRQA
jgi:hypothetical protein